MQSQSNDDRGEDGYIDEINERLQKLKSSPNYIISAFCPTREPSNDSRRIIQKLYQNSDIYLITLEHKWCLHAKIDINELTKYYSDVNNLTLVNINEKDPTKKADLIKKEICKLCIKAHISQTKEERFSQCPLAHLLPRWEDGNIYDYAQIV